MIRIITTEDGSHSLFHEELNETYHSARGARGESLHVFIKEGLNHWLSSNKSKQARILEVGLGTGLNAFLTVLEAESQPIFFTSLEPFPIERSIYENLNFHQSDEEKALLMKIHESKWETVETLSKNFMLFKTETRLEAFTDQEPYHIIYFDAFAPSKQPEVWSLENLRKCYDLLEPGGILTTYCAQGQFKRNLVEVGFEIETLQGAMGKKEMVRAVKPI